MDDGALVPDELVMKIVKAELDTPAAQENGWLLDGAPRTGVQAKELKGLGVHPDIYILLECPDAVMIERGCGRRSDPVTNKIYHMKFNPPPNDPVIRKRLTQRADDTEATVGERIKTFRDQTRDVEPHYEDVMLRISALPGRKEIFAEICAALAKL